MSDIKNMKISLLPKGLIYAALQKNELDEKVVKENTDLVYNAIVEFIGNTHAIAYVEDRLDFLQIGGIEEKEEES